jgi:hypothetical protein
MDRGIPEAEGDGEVWLAEVDGGRGGSALTTMFMIFVLLLAMVVML